MHRIIIGLLIFVAGWGFGWYTHNYQGTDRIQFTQSDISVPSSTFDKPAASVTPQAPVLADNMANMLMHNDFDAALNHYESLQVQADDMAASKARTQILSYANSLIEDHRFGLAEKLLQRFLVTAHRDVDARILLAAAYYGQKDFKVTIDQLYEAKGYAYRQDMQQRIIRRIRSVVAEQMQLLKRNNDQGALLAFFQHLTQLEPSHASYFIELATAQLALDNKEAARISLQLVLYDSDVGPQARAMLSELNLALARLQDADSPVSVEDVVGIPLHRSGNSFLVDARSADGQSIRLLI
ncbi:MAG: hypothetical protein OEX83_04550, partial [Gammaproteobacteria bacterium]|nr:hypothetical protein [Gammaproteobacteria bacterium]